MAKKNRALERILEKACRGTPEHPAQLTDEEHELLLRLIRLHRLHCTDPNRPNCRDKGGYLRGRPWYGNDPEKARAFGLLV